VPFERLEVRFWQIHLNFYAYVYEIFTCFTSVVSLFQCPKPVISVVHNACIGGALDLITAADIRYCSSDAWFQVKEVDIGKWNQQEQSYLKDLFAVRKIHVNIEYKLHLMFIAFISPLVLLSWKRVLWLRALQTTSVVFMQCGQRYRIEWFQLTVIFSIGTHTSYHGIFLTAVGCNWQ
jgi:hypothetical protein